MELDEEILKSIQIIVDKAIKIITETTDKTVTGSIVGRISKSNNYSYDVNLPNGEIYTIVDTEKYNVGDKVWVRIPNGSYSNMYIDKKKI